MEIVDGFIFWIFFMCNFNENDLIYVLIIFKIEEIFFFLKDFF